MTGPLLAGAARRSVTPPDAVRLAGHASRTEPSEGVASPLAVRALALADGTERILLAVADALWWPPEEADSIRGRVAVELGLATDAVILHATHTHSAPQPSVAFAPTLGPPDPAFLAALEAGVLAAGRQALAELTPCRLLAGVAHEAIGVHRRAVVDGAVRMAPYHDVPVDDRVRVVQLRSARGVVATVVHHACHPTSTGDNLVSSDWPGALARRLDVSEGGTTLVLQGCAGDVRPGLETPEGAFRLGTEADVEDLGSRLAAAAGVALATASALEPAPLCVTATRVPLTLESGTPVPLRLVAATLAEGWRLVGLACEPVGRYQEAAPEAWVLGYTNGMVGYLPTAEQRRAGGYEPLGSLPHFRLDSPFGPDTEDLVAGAISHA